MKLRIHRFLPVTNVEGPGKRACVWVQGCSRHCPGCAAQPTWNKDKGIEIDVRELAQKILNGPEVEGITFVGGEPFEQAEALSELALLLKRKNLSIVTFTGYSLEELQESTNDGIKDLISLTDILIDGPYLQERKDLSRPWVGSSNQRYHFLTDRYKHIKDNICETKNQIEIRMDSMGKILINGMGDFNAIKGLFEV
ncbi:4Fe-4S single cluster domain-containing protein [Clostridium drakei]|uniref:Anaerobic ribonucleoside-triphosphate reductase-activating protein n=1 Tax=Clostridium drakei TaxID=332101 RepID=A0A2U8DPS7_9CLOT|nr:4Fe-4S single cluster domain-containing protein [Clostridium drakei]AWI04598.1 ribonucleoside-triphosphate reductase activating protein [Clostridium drakei]